MSQAALLVGATFTPQGLQQALYIRVQRLPAIGEARRTEPPAVGKRARHDTGAVGILGKNLRYGDVHIPQVATSVDPEACTSQYLDR